jgi:hypothetical protein
MVPLLLSGRGRVPYGRADRNFRDHASLGRVWSTLMRHFFSSPALKAVLVLASGVLPPPFATGLIPHAGGIQAAAAGSSGTGTRAVAVPTVTPTAEEEELSARRSSAGGKSK